VVILPGERYPAAFQQLFGQLQFLTVLRFQFVEFQDHADFFLFDRAQTFA
jgi:hypothetical protein